MKKDTLVRIFAALIMAGSTLALAHYSQWKPQLLMWAVLFALALLALNQKPFSYLERKALITAGFFSIFLDLSLILGFHLIITGSYYFGFSWENYISPYSLRDILAFVVMLPSIFVFTFTPYALIRRKQAALSKRTRRSKAPVCRSGKTVLRMNRKWLWGGAALLFVLWLPYLLTYWPGFVFGDTLWSFNQTLGVTSWNNHHPVTYTAYIAFCFNVAHILGFGNTAGCAIYSITQMAFMACSFSYLSQWVVTRGQLRSIWGALILALFGLTPFIAVYSIAMWKDPVFSCAVMLLSVMLFDYIDTKGSIALSNKLWPLAFVVFMAIVCLLRTNGIAIAVLITLVIAFNHFTKERLTQAHRKLRYFALASVAVVVASILFLGPVSTLLGIERTGSSEGTGILYNQMARVVVFNGEMSESNEKYLASQLPIDKYQETYRPCCFDMLKLAFQENGARFDTHQLLTNWLSMLPANASLYLESWELQTFGFWVINEPGLVRFENIAQGTPRNTTQNAAEGSYALASEFNVYAESKLPGDVNFWRTIFPQDMWTPPAAIFFWICIYLVCLCCLTGRRKWALSLLPTLALFLTMLVATPFCYWPRYVAAAYFLAPFYAFIAFMLLSQRNACKTSG